MVRKYFAEFFEISSYKHLLYFLSSWLVVGLFWYGLGVVFNISPLRMGRTDVYTELAGVGSFAEFLGFNANTSPITAWLMILLRFTLFLFFLPTAAWLGLQFLRLERWRVKVLLDLNVPQPISIHHSNVWAWWRFEVMTLGTFRGMTYLLLHFGFATSTLLFLGAMLYFTGFLLFAPIVALWDSDTTSFRQSFWRDSLVWTGIESIKFSGFSTLIATLAGIPMLILTLQLTNFLARVWKKAAEAGLSSDTDSQRSLDALERAGKSVLEDNTSTAIETILREGIAASNAFGASLGTLRLNLEPDNMLGGENFSLFIPIEQKTELIAVFKNAPPNPRDKNLWNALGTHASTALRLQHLLNRERTEASEQERSRIARELHDSVAQALYGISLGTRSALEQLESNPKNAKQALEYAIDLADGGTSEMKTLLFALRPDALEEGGLAAALQKLGEMLKARYKLESTISAPLEPDVPLEVKGALYRIAQEAVHNTVKHAKAKLVSINLEKSSLEISDNGIGFNLNATRAGALGLKSMRERAESIGANFDMTSSSIGTQILVDFGDAK